MSNYSPLSSFSGAKLPLRPMHVWGIRVRPQVDRRIRDLALFDLAIDSKLRAATWLCELAMWCRPEACDGVPSCFSKRPDAPSSLSLPIRPANPLRDGCRPGYGSDWLFPSRQWPGEHLSTRQYSRLVKWWVDLIGLEPSSYGTHSLRRTKVSLLYKKTGNLRACQLLLGHTKLESTVRYLGVEFDDALLMSEALEL